MNATWPPPSIRADAGERAWGAALRVFIALLILLPLVYGGNHLYSRRLGRGE